MKYKDFELNNYHYNIQNIVKDILVDLDEYPNLEWKLGNLKHSRFASSTYFPNRAHGYDCIADLNIISLTKLLNLEKGWKPIVERVISQLNDEGFIIFELPNKVEWDSNHLVPSVERISDNWMRDSSGLYYKTFKICLLN